MFDRILADGRATVMHTANGFGIALGGDQVLRSWRASQEETTSPDEDKGAIARQAATIRRLRGLFGQQPSPSWRNAIQVKHTDA